MKLIDKDALVAEIKKHQAIWDGMDDDYCKGQRLAYSDVISFLDTLEVREVREESVSKDLEEAAFDYAEACKYDGGEKLLCVEHFKAGAQWQKQQNTLEPKEVDLEKELDKEWNKCEPTDEGMGLEIASIEHEQFDNIAKHFFELGIKAAQKGDEL